MDTLARLTQVRASLARHDTAAAQLKAEQARLLRRLLEVHSGDEVARMVGVSRQQVYRLLRHG